MFGCLGRLGCLVLMAALAALAWLTQDSWYPKVRARWHGGGFAHAKVATWEPLTAAGAARGREAVNQLTRRNGPVYVNVAAADLAAFLLDSVLPGVGPGTTGAEAIVKGERLYVRAPVDLALLGGTASLGPLASMFEGKQEVTLGGRLEVLTPGHAQFRVEEMQLKELPLPSPMIQKLVARLAPKGRDATIAPDGIPLHVPPELADVRIAKGRVTLYKNVP